MARCQSEGAQRMRTEVRTKLQIGNKKINITALLEYEEHAAERFFLVR